MKYVGQQKDRQDLTTLTHVARYVTGTYTIMPEDHDALILVDSQSASVQLNFPADLPDGHHVKVWQFNKGQVTFSAPGRAIRSNATRIQTRFQSDVVDVYCTSGSAVLAMVFTNVPTTQYTWNNAAISTTTTADIAWTSTEPAIFLEPNSVYEISYRVTFRTTNIMQAFKMGFGNLSADTQVQIEGRIAQTDLSGTATKRFMDLLAPTGMSAGGTSSVVNANLLGVLIGRITTGSSGQTLVPNLGAVNTTGTVTVAAGAATLLVRKMGGAPTSQAAMGPELITDLGSSAWTKTTGVTASGQNMQATNGANMLYHRELLVAGNTYKVILPMTFTAGAQVRINNVGPGSSDPGVINWTCINGTLEGTFVATGPYFSLEARNATFTGSITGMSCKQML